jgi:hypothetical protein
MGSLPHDVMEEKGYWLVCLNPHAPPGKIQNQEANGMGVSRIAKLFAHGGEPGA